MTRRRDWIIPFGIAAAAFLALLPVLRSAFFNLDDPQNLLQNDLYRGLGLANLKWMFLSYQMGMDGIPRLYQPLQWLTHAADYLLWGLRPIGFKLDSLLLHCLAAMAFYRVCLRLFDSEGEPRPTAPWVAAFSALLWAAHPMRVEAVAWASNRSYVLSGLFCAASLWCYLEVYGRSEVNRPLWRLLSVFAFALSLGSKALAMAFPILLLLLDVYPLRRLGQGRWWGKEALAVYAEKLPYALLAALQAVVTYYGREASASIIPFAEFGLLPRVAQAVFSTSFYIEKTLVPWGLHPGYSVPLRSFRIHPLDLLCLLRTLLFIGTSVLLWRRRREWPAALAAFLAYLLLLAPVSGLAKYDVLVQIASDRWSYLASTAFAVLAGAALIKAWEKWGKPAPACAAAVLLLMGSLAWRQSSRWRTPEDIWRHSVSSDPECLHCQQTLATVLLDEAKYADADACSRQALLLDPDCVNTYVLLARAALGQGNLAAAQRFAETTRRLHPPLAKGWANSEFTAGFRLSSEGRADQALERTWTAALLDPDHAQARYNLSFMLSQKGRLDEAIEQTAAAVRLNPQAVNARFNLGFFLHQKGDLAGAERLYREAVQLDPGAVNAQQNLGVLLAAQGRRAEAAAHCEAAFRLNPSLSNPLCPRK
jgi:tetratricopeptide (TPR) repeat protein